MRDRNPQPLDAGAIYIAGTLVEGTEYNDALADLFNPNLASTGFNRFFESGNAIIRPSDGTLLYYYLTESLLREYHCDNCAVTSVATPYPSNVLANDPIVPTPCPGTDRFESFLVSAEGEVLHRCYGATTVWRDSTGAAVYTTIGTDALLRLGSLGWALSKSRVINWKTGTMNPIVGLPPFGTYTVLATRFAPPDAFWMALRNGGVEELWRVEPSGVASWTGTYLPHPFTPPGGVGYLLDRTGRLFQKGSDTTTNFVDVVVMKEIGAPSIVVYTEATNPLVKLHISALVTGP